MTKPIRKRRKQPVFKGWLAAASLIVLALLACTSLGVLATSWTLLRTEGMIARGTFGRSAGSGERATPTRSAAPVRFEAGGSAPGKPLPLEGEPTPAPLLLPEPAPTQEPTPTSTQVVVPTPTATETPSPTPVPTDLPPPTPPPLPTDTPVPAEVKQIVIISIDGLRPDALAQAPTPNLDRLISQGTYCPTAKSVQPSQTMANHASMLGGMVPDKHGIFWDLLSPDVPRIAGPTLFSVAHDAGLSTAMVVGKPKLEYLVVPGSVDKFIGGEYGDAEVKNQAIEVIRAGLPNVLFVHLPDTDRVGHAAGWMSAEQLQAVAAADGFVGEIVAALETGGYLNSTLLIVTADHGGNGKGHNSPDAPENSIVPWIAVGPGVPAGVTLARTVNMYDTAATAAQALNLSRPGQWDGQPVMEIFSSP